ncbi:MAG: hypothetical protein LH645_09460 [Actinomycetia bacterium]|nr:hypothetical protein [Actinomycetes bacterium]
MSATCNPAKGRVDLYWIPLGAGAALPVVRWSGRLFEGVAALRARRRPENLYHAALEIWLDDVRSTVEMAPAWGSGHGREGVVGEGPVGLRMLGRSRFFRYELRRWRGGIIPDLAEAVDGPTRVTTDSDQTLAVLEAVSSFPRVTWGRDELKTGDMWNSNSLVAWALTHAGVDLSSVSPPRGGRAPGWSAGVVAATR